MHSKCVGSASTGEVCRFSTYDRLRPHPVVRELGFSPAPHGSCFVAARAAGYLLLLRRIVKLKEKWTAAERWHQGGR